MPFRVNMGETRSIKITKLIVKNYRGIGSVGLEIDIDDVVVLVGPNNSGKSTILKAFQLVTASSDTVIKIDDFHNRDENNHPEIEVWSRVIDRKSVHIGAKEWIDSTDLVKEKWIWERAGSAAVRYGYRVDLGHWATSLDEPKAPFSNDGAAVAYRPFPTYISPFDHPERQVEEIKKILSTDIYDQIKKEKKEDPRFKDLMEKISQFQEEIKFEARIKEEDIADGISVILNDLFEGTKVSLHVPQVSPDVLQAYANTKDIDFKINDLSLENQGSGMLRMLLWSILKMLASKRSTESKSKKSTSKKISNESSDSDVIKSERSKILLMDEPEICLHPESIRQAKDILYSLSSEGEWQTMITTHSPVFLDLSKDNTNIIRVQKDETAVSIYKTNDASLSDGEKERLKMLNIFDPYFAEFFFSKNTIVVEGDTEYTAFRKIIEFNREKYKDIHIIRARGKYTIIPIIKILQKWGKDFSILHDSDEETNAGPWTANQQILDLIPDLQREKIKLVATKKNFENAFFSKEATKDKPFNAYVKLDDPVIRAKVGKLLDFLCGLDTEIDSGLQESVCEYKTIEELALFVK